VIKRFSHIPANVNGLYFDGAKVNYVARFTLLVDNKVNVAGSFSVYIFEFDFGYERPRSIGAEKELSRVLSDNP
jgi:hypothetical protein